MLTRLQKKDLIAKFAEVVGIEKATSLVEDGMAKNGIAEKTDLNRDDVIKVSETIKANQPDKLVQIIAGCLLIEARMSKVE